MEIKQFNWFSIGDYNHNHYRFFSKETWNLLLKKYGFSNIRHFNEDVEGYKSYSYILAKLKK